MNIPTPTPLGSRPTFALGAPFGHIIASQWERAAGSGACAVILHTLGGEKERTDIGPRELRDTTTASLARIGCDQPWGLGGVVREPEDAAQFATAGFTWFTFDLRSLINRRATGMSLEELDAAIVGLEDAGCFSPDWHAAYLDRTFGTTPPLQFTDEQLARAAVAFGPALAHAEQLQQSVRTCWTGRGNLPDIEISIAAARIPTTPLETLFITQELRRRAIFATAFSPSLGIAWPLGAPTTIEADELRTTIAAHESACALARIDKMGIHLADEKHSALECLNVTHRDECTGAWLEALRLTLTEEPALFRAWLLTSRESFALARGDQPIDLDDDEASGLPEVADDQLAEMFLDAPKGRQLLLATLDDVRASDAGVKLREFLAMAFRGYHPTP